MTTPVEQFVSDFTLVVDNDQEAYNEARECVSNHTHLHEASDCLRDQYERAIVEALEVLKGNWGVQDVTVDLMSQILLGWGSDAFDRIARHYMEKE